MNAAFQQAAHNVLIDDENLLQRFHINVITKSTDKSKLIIQAGGMFYISRTFFRSNETLNLVLLLFCLLGTKMFIFCTDQAYIFVRPYDKTFQMMSQFDLDLTPTLRLDAC